MSVLLVVIKIYDIWGGRAAVTCGGLVIADEEN